MSTVTEHSCARVLAIVAEWMGRHGMGVPVCTHGKEYDERRFMLHTDGTDCDSRTFDPAPTGSAAARHGLGPMLNPAWDWPDTPTPTVILEGGPDDWAVRCTFDVQRAADAEDLGVFVEPYASYALCIYPA